MGTAVLNRYHHHEFFVRYQQYFDSYNRRRRLDLVRADGSLAVPLFLVSDAPQFVKAVDPGGA